MAGPACRRFSQALQKSTRHQRVPKWTDHPGNPSNVGTSSPGTHRCIEVHCLRRCREPTGSQRKQVVPRDGAPDINVVVLSQELRDLQTLRPPGKPVPGIEPHLLAPHLFQRRALCRLPEGLERHRCVQCVGHAPKATDPSGQTRAVAPPIGYDLPPPHEQSEEQPPLPTELQWHLVFAAATPTNQAH